MTPEEQQRTEEHCKRLLEVMADGMPNPVCADLTYYTRTKRKEGHQYKAKRFLVSEGASGEMGANFSEVMRNLVSDEEGELKRQEWYDIDAGSDVVYFIPADEVSIALEEMRDAAAVGCSDEDLALVMEMANIQRCAYTFGNGEVVYAYNKIQRQASLKRKFAFFSTDGTRVTTEIPNFLHLTYVPDAIEHDGLIVAFNRRGFEFVFSYTEALARFVEQHRELLENSGVIDNAEGFLNACMGSSRRMQRLKRFMLSDRVHELAEHRANVPNVIEEYGLDIDAPDGVIHYDPNRGVGHLDHILKLFGRLCVRDALTDAKMFAAEIETENVDRANGGR